MKKFLFLTCACAGSLAWNGAAMAQSAPPASAADGTTDGNTIIVTALKREQSVQDVPISMVVLDGEKLQDDGIFDFRALAAQIPGITYIESPTIPVLQLRGFASPANNPASDQTVAVYNDGISLGRARLFQAPFSTPSGSKCCADRKARCSARIPPPVRSVSCPRRRPTASMRV